MLYCRRTVLILKKDKPLNGKQVLLHFHPTKACDRLLDKQQDHHCSQHSGVVQSITFLPGLNAGLPFSNSSTSHCLSKLKNKNFSLTELQGQNMLFTIQKTHFLNQMHPKAEFSKATCSEYLMWPRIKLTGQKNPLDLSNWLLSH